MSHPGRPGKVPGRDGAGQDLETLKLPLALLILNSARAWSPSLCKVLKLVPVCWLPFSQHIYLASAISCASTDYLPVRVFLACRAVGIGGQRAGNSPRFW